MRLKTCLTIISLPFMNDYDDSHALSQVKNIINCANLK